MATVVGTVSFISGVVYAVKADGTERLLALGDEVFADEVLRTGPQAKVEITMDNGEVVALGEQQSWLVSAESFLDADEYPVEESVINQDVASIDAIQQAILAGADPTQVAEPTAAGTPAAGDAGAVTGNEGSSFTTISRTAQEGNPEAGFDTTGPGTAQQTQTQFTPELINRAPEATPDFITTAEDTPVFDRIDATDADGDLLTYTLVSAPENGTAVINADGTYTYTPNENYNGDDAFIVRVDDGRGGVIEVPVSVVITPVNDAPNANAFQETTPEDTPISSAVFTTDVDGDTLTYSLGSGPSNGTVVINSDGTYTYTPSQDFNGNDRFFVTADDGNGGTTQIPVDIIVTPVNDAPTAGAFSESTPEDTPFTDSVFAQDVDGDTLTYSLNTGPSNGSVSLNANGTYTYTPNNGFIGNDSFTVTASDGNGGTVTIPVSINVFPLNDAPVALADSASTQENTPVLISVTGNDSDPDGTINPSTVNIISGPSNGSLVVNSDGTVEYTPNSGYTGPDSFQYTVQDNDGATSNIATVTIGVDAPVNLPPTATDDNQGVIEDTSATINLAANDSDPDDGLDLTSIVITDQPDHGTLVVNNDGTVTYTPDSNYNGPDSFKYTIADAAGNVSNEATVNLTVTPDNDPPVAVNDSGSTAEDTPVNIDLAGNDSDADDGLDLTSIVITDQPDHGTLVVNNDGTVTYTPDNNYNGPDSFKYTIADAAGNVSNEATVNLTVTPENDPPVAVNDSGSTAEDTPVNIDLAGNDSDADDGLDLTSIVITDQPDHGTLVVNNDGTVTYTPDNNYNGPDSFKYTIADAAGNVSNEATVNLTVTPDNDPPVAVNDSGSTAEDTPVNIDLAGNDSDADDGLDLTSIVITDQPDHGTLVVNNDGTVTYTPDNNYNGPDSFKYTIADAAGNVSNEATVNLTVTPENDPPVAVNDSGSTAEDTPVNIDLAGNDSDADDGLDLTSIVITDQPDHGTLVVNNDGTVTYTPDSNYNGPDSFKYTIADAAGNVSNEATVNLTVTPDNDPPVAVNDSGSTAEDTPVNIDLAGNDSDADDGLDLTSIVITDQPDHGTLVVNNDGTVTYTPDSNYNGPDSFKYTIADAAGNVSNEATVNLTVTPDNDPPVAVNDSGSTAEDTPVNIDLAGNDSDVDDGLDLTSIVITDQPDHGTLVVNNDGTVTYTPDSNYNGPDSFKYTIADAAGNVSNEAEVLLNVVGNNNSVVATDDGGATSGFVYVGANGGSWTAQGVTVEAFNADGSAGTIVRNTSFGFGVAGTPDPDDTRKNPPQIEYDTATNTSESLVFTYDDFVTSAEVDISRLYGSESVNGNVHIEQGAWIAYVVDDSGNQRVVAGDEFSFASSSNGGTITITVPPGYVFNRIEFIATEYGDGRDTTGSGDSSDYFVQGVSATTMLSSYQTTEGDDLTLSVGDLLANDSDPNGDTFGFAGIVDVNGQLVTTGSAIVDANGATVTINGSTLTYNSGNQGLNVGETGSVDFTYRIEDANGATDDADVSLTVVGTQGSSGSLNLDGTSGDDILDGASGVDTFVWLDGESGTDTINNFEIGGPGVGDRLDLSDLLVGEENNPLSDYLSVSTNGTDTTIEIRPQGSGGSVEQTIVLDNVTGVTLQDLVNNDQIITD